MIGLERTWRAFVPSVLLIAPAHALAHQPKPVQMAEHHYNPESRLVETRYKCGDGSRSVTLQYGSDLKARISGISRGGRAASPEVRNGINSLLSRYDYVHSLFPQCGRKDDLLSVVVRDGSKRKVLLIRWSLTDVTLDQIVE